VLTNMPLPILDISSALKLASGDVNKLQIVINQISEAIARNQSPKSKFSLGEGYSQHISLGVRYSHHPLSLGTTHSQLLV